MVCYIRNAWFALCWYCIKIFGKKYETRYSHCRTKRSVIVFGEKSILCPNEKGGVDYTEREQESMSACCASCGKHIMLGDPVGMVSRNENLPSDIRIAMWPERGEIFVGCTGCLDMGIADAIGRWMPTEHNPFLASAKTMPFDQIASIEYVPGGDDDSPMADTILDPVGEENQFQ